MINYLNRPLIISLIFNVLLVSLLAYTKRSSIITRINNFYKTSKTKNAVAFKQLESMNNGFIPLYVDTCNFKNGDDLKILIIGNSLSYHNIAKEIGWNHISGMAASSKENDFSHKLFYKIENMFPKSNICLRIASFASFERNLESFNQNSIDSLKEFKPDIIIFQLGENVNIEEPNISKLFQVKYIELITCFKKNTNLITICSTPFFPNLQKNNVIEEVALKTKSYLVDLSHLPLLDTENYAKDEKAYYGDKTLWKVDGIGIHPGDKGMEKIAQQLAITINAAITKSNFSLTSVEK